MATRLSVLTLVRDRSAHLDVLIEGLRRSDRTPNELIIIDMGSRVPVLTPSLPWPTTVLRIESERLPLAAARNRAAGAASGDYLLFLDVDCIPGANLINAIAEVLDSHDALICAEIRYLGPDDARGAWDESALLAIGAPHPARDFPEAGLREEADPGLFWSLAFGIGAARFRDLGGFDERFVGYGAEDTDFGFRAHAAGVPLFFLGGARAFHQWHPSPEPPLQHLDDIVRNARTFFALWQCWPMEGWLTAFAQMGLIAWTPTTCRSYVLIPKTTRQKVRSAWGRPLRYRDKPEVASAEVAVIPLSGLRKRRHVRSAA